MKGGGLRQSLATKEMKVGAREASTLQSPGDEIFPERKFQRAAKGPVRSLASEQPMCVRKPPKAEEEPPGRIGENNP